MRPAPPRADLAPPRALRAAPAPRPSTRGRHRDRPPAGRAPCSRVRRSDSRRASSRPSACSSAARRSSSDCRRPSRASPRESCDSFSFCLPLSSSRSAKRPRRRIQSVLALAPRVELPRDPADPSIQLFLPLGELTLALGQLRCSLSKLGLRSSQIVEGCRAGEATLLEDVRIHRFRAGRRLALARRSPHSHVLAPGPFVRGIGEVNGTLR